MNRHRPHQPDCVSNDKSSRSLLPPELSSVVARIDPVTDPYPRYAGKRRRLPIEQFEQLLDQKDLNSIQL